MYQNEILKVNAIFKENKGKKLYEYLKGYELYGNEENNIKMLCMV